MVTRKDRRHSGRRYEKICHPENFPYERQLYDEWTNYRDGQRSPVDRSKIRPTRGLSDWFIKNCHIVEDNLKLKKKEKIRRLRQNGRDTDTME